MAKLTLDDADLDHVLGTGSTSTDPDQDQTKKRIPAQAAATAALPMPKPVVPTTLQGAAPAKAEIPTAPEIPSTPPPAVPMLSGAPAEIPKPTRAESNAAGKKEYEQGVAQHQVTAAPGTPEYGQQRQALLDYKNQHHLGTDISANNGWTGKLLHGLATAGNIAGNIVAPADMALIPGTQLHNELEAKGNQNWIKQGEQNKLESAEATKDLTPPDKFAFHYQDPNGNEIGVRPDGTTEQLPQGAVTPARERENNIGAYVKNPNDPDAKKKVEADPSTWHKDVPFNGTIGKDGQLVADPNAPQILIDRNMVTGTVQQAGNPKQAATPALHMQSGTIGGQPAYAAYDQKNKTFVDQHGTPVPDFKPTPSYAQAMAGTHTTDVLDPTTQLPIKLQFNPKTGSYDLPIGLSASGAVAGREAQAGAVVRAGEGLIADIQANEKAIDVSKLGDFSTWVEKYGLDTPFADPVLAQLQAEYMSFAALNPAMHGFRSAEAMRGFESLVGGLQKNPEAAIASIRGIEKTAHAMAPGTANNAPPDVQVPKGWTWTTVGGKQGITDGKQFRPYQGQ